jgi:Uncharacterized conserved protein (DUF2278)
VTSGRHLSYWQDPAPKPGIDTEFSTVDGMHDIHMNQGNAPHDHDEDNGVFNDGGLLLLFPDHVAGLFFRFKTQFLPTDDKGDRIPGISKEIPPSGSVESRRTRRPATLNQPLHRCTSSARS